MRVGTSIWVAFLGACGGRLESETNARVDASDDARAVMMDAASRDATAEASIIDSASCMPGVCSPPMVTLSIGSDNMQCKYTITWTCGTTPYEVHSLPGAKGCNPTFDANRGFHGSCSQCGMMASTFSLSDPSGCTCFDTTKLAALAAKQCGFPL